MRKIAVYTGSRADYNCLKYLINNMACAHIETRGMYGLESELREKLRRANPAILVLLGDRFETLICASVAAELCIPIAHINGGDETLGATDNAYRHAITKLSYWHFVSCESSMLRVMQMGEQPSRTFLVGSPQLDAIAFERHMSIKECEQELGIQIEFPLWLFCYHPETLCQIEPLKQIKLAIDWLKDEPGTLVISGANMDAGGAEINGYLRNFSRPNTIYRASFDSTLYVNLMRHCHAVVGNSSAFAIMAPTLGKRALLIGNRQEGRPGESFGIPGQVTPAIKQKLLDVGIPERPIKRFKTLVISETPNLLPATP